MPGEFRHHRLAVFFTRIITIDFKFFQDIVEHRSQILTIYFFTHNFKFLKSCCEELLRIYL